MIGPQQWWAKLWLIDYGWSLAHSKNHPVRDECLSVGLFKCWIPPVCKTSVMQHRRSQRGRGKSTILDRVWSLGITIPECFWERKIRKYEKPSETVQVIDDISITFTCLCSVKSTFTKQPNKHVARCIMAITLKYRAKRWPRYNSHSSSQN